MTAADDSRTIESIIDEGITIPPMPDVLVQLEYLYLDPDSEPRRYAEHITQDAMISGAMFRVANSPIFNRSHNRVDSLENAVMLLGSKNTMAVVRSEALRKALTDQANAALVNILWQRQSAIADLMLHAAKIAGQKGLRSDLLYLFGIFHDCGIVLLAKKHWEYGQIFFSAAGWPNLPSLDAAFKTDHALIGELLARNWNLPEEVALATRHHHNLDIANLTANIQVMIALLQLATHLHNQATHADDLCWTDWKPQVEALLRLDDNTLAELETEVADAFFAGLS